MNSSSTQAVNDVNAAESQQAADQAKYQEDLASMDSIEDMILVVFPDMLQLGLDQIEYLGAQAEVLGAAMSDVNEIGDSFNDAYNATVLVLSSDPDGGEAEAQQDATDAIDSATDLENLMAADPELFGDPTQEGSTAYDVNENLAVLFGGTVYSYNPDTGEYDADYSSVDEIGDNWVNAFSPMVEAEQNADSGSTTGGGGSSGDVTDYTQPYTNAINNMMTSFEGLSATNQSQQTYAVNAAKALSGTEKSLERSYAQMEQTAVNNEVKS